jgi:hypothetical protein
MEKENKLFALIEEVVGGYPTRVIEITKGLEFNQYETLRTIAFYSNSKYLGGQKDELGRDKPFNNINTFRVNVAYRATDLDLKDIQITADDISDKENQIKAMILSKEAYKWGKNNNLSEFLNEFGYTRAKYGDVLVKKCLEKDEDGKDKLELEVKKCIEKDDETGKDELELEVCAWKNTITDPIDIDEGIIIEKHYFKAHELAEKSDVWEHTDEVLELAGKTKEDIEVYEVNGYFAEEVDPDASGSDKYTYNYKKLLLANVGNKKFLLMSED